MQLFLIFAVPISYLYFLTVTGQRSASPVVLTRASAKGAGFSLVALASVAVLRRFVTVSEAGFVYYFVTSVKDMWLPTVLLIGLYAWSTPGLKDQPPADRQAGLRSFLAGGFTVLSFFDLFLPAGAYDIYDLFLLPSIRVSLMFAIPSMFFWYSDTTTWYRYAILIAIMLLPFAYGVVFFLQSAYFLTWAVFATIILLLAGVSLAVATGGGLRSLRY